MTLNTYSKINKVYFLFPLLMCLQFAYAQDGGHTPAEVELQHKRSFWRTAANPAGLQLDNPFQYSQLKFNQESYGGNFYRPQEGRLGNRQGVSTEGNMFINDYYFNGSFSYTRDNIKEANFNSSILDPFRGMPYIVADLNPSDWNNQLYKLQFNIATPQYNNRWSLGLKVNYDATNGAKQRDLRTENQYFGLSVKPGVVYAIKDNQHVGLDLKYSNMKEESAMTRINTNVDYIYYELLGLGTGINRLGSGSNVNYMGESLGGGLQYGFQGDVSFLLSANYALEAEDQQFSFTTPRRAASVSRRVWTANFNIEKKGDRLSQIADLSYYNRGIDGIQYITQFDNSPSQLGWMILYKNVRSTYSTENIGFQYSLLANRGNEYSWMIDARVNYNKLADEYILPNSIKNIENVSFGINGKRNFVMSDHKSKRLLVGLGIQYKTNLSSEYVYNGLAKDSPIVTELEQNDFNYLSADFVALELPITYSQQFKAGKDNQFFIKAKGQYLSTSSFDYNKRHAINISVGTFF